MNVKKEINNYAQKNNKDILLWLFERYHYQSQWQFVAKCSFADMKREWYPTSEGMILYDYHHDLNL